MLAQRKRISDWEEPKSGEPKRDESATTAAIKKP
jgi:hypothetical protein